MVYKYGRFGKFLACPGYPECKNTKAIVEYIDVPCPVCGSKVIEKKTLRNQILFDVTLVALLVLAVMGAYSRVYLSQHFLSDVCVGSIIGFTMPWVVFYYSREKIMKLEK